MASMGESVRVYRELAEIYAKQGQAQMRDRFLVLAADAALTAGGADEAERLRGVLLEYNPHHLLKPYASLSEALKSADVRNYVTALRRSHPYERAEHLLETLTREGDELEQTHPMPLPPTLDGSKKAPPDELKVFRVQEPEEAARPAAPPPPAPRTKPQPAAPASPPARPPKAEPVRPAAAARPAAPDIFPIRREPTVPAAAPGTARGAEDEEHNRGGWVAIGLFWLLGLLAVLLGVYTLVRSFLPPGWLPG